MRKKSGDDDPTAATTLESVGDEYLLSNDDEDNDDDGAYIPSADTFSIGAEAISIYGTNGKYAPWNLACSGMIVTSRIFKVR